MRTQKMCEQAYVWAAMGRQVEVVVKDHMQASDLALAMRKKFLGVTHLMHKRAVKLAHGGQIRFHSAERLQESDAIYAFSGCKYYLLIDHAVDAGRLPIDLIRRAQKEDQ